MCHGLRETAFRAFELGLVGDRGINNFCNLNQAESAAGVVGSRVGGKRPGLQSHCRIDHGGRQSPGVVAAYRQQRRPLEIRDGLAGAQGFQLGLAVFPGKLARFFTRQFGDDGFVNLRQRPDAGRLVLEHSCGDQGIGCRFNGFGIALVLDDVVGKQRLAQLRIVERRQRPLPLGNPRALADGEAGNFRGRLQAGRLLVRGIGKFLGDFGEFALCLLLPEFAFDFRCGLSQRLAFFRTNIGQQDDVVAEVG